MGTVPGTPGQMVAIFIYNYQVSHDRQGKSELKETSQKRWHKPQGTMTVAVDLECRMAHKVCL